MPDIKEAAIQLNLSELKTTNNIGLCQLKGLDPRYKGKEGQKVEGYDYKPGSDSINYTTQFGSIPKAEAIDFMDGDFNRPSSRTIVIDGQEYDLKEEVEKYLTDHAPELRKNTTSLSPTFHYYAIKAYLKGPSCNLSEHQANFILLSSHQNSFAKSIEGLSLSYTHEKDKEELFIETAVADGVDFMLEINKGECSISSSKTTHFVDMTNSYLIEERDNGYGYYSYNFIKDKANFITTPNCITTNFRINLGKPGAVIEPETIVELAARGDCCTIINTIKNQNIYETINPNIVQKNSDKFFKTILGEKQFNQNKEQILTNLAKYELENKPDFDLQFTTVKNQNKEQILTDLAQYELDDKANFDLQFTTVKKGLFSKIASRLKDMINGHKPTYHKEIKSLPTKTIQKLEDNDKLLEDSSKPLYQNNTVVKLVPPKKVKIKFQIILSRLKWGSKTKAITSTTVSNNKIHNNINSSKKNTLFSLFSK